ncbi:LpxI family protein [Chelativorans salis]|uniref:UDP-2,3-diacylglucosamine diphosphatase LpxI n=1 Tax=Chelativorans salis TaxID=2978478 RepID=A0ABT2LM26_9HYPH|nr:UDP-2,3-diacylglucosamine diphosphatase LpxI [Chelativorans sp. EGI FJ00035]MCT7375636.1 UDP-2,3-diacylglucosamine diphosphatase LpxI [Chelativorans sp. EGI FJ00035]
MTTAWNDEPRRPAIGAGDRIAIIAGSGRLPEDVVEALVGAGHRPLVVGIEGEAAFAEAPDRYELLHVPAQRLGLLMPTLKRHGVTHLVLSGGVSVRPPLGSLRFHPAFLLHLPRLVTAYARGDDALLRMLVGYVEANGIRVVGAHELVPELLAPEGLLSKAKPTRGDEKDIVAALAAARAIGRLDIGQAAIAIGGRAVALEGIEGTDGLLARTKELRSHGRLAGKGRGVLVKCAKPGQEARADLPTIGPQTVTAAHGAGLAGIAVEAGLSFILASAETVSLADRHGLFLLGFARGREQ